VIDIVLVLLGAIIFEEVFPLLGFQWVVWGMAEVAVAGEFIQGFMEIGDKAFE
jgi:hypothetical protein